jgi:predicted ribosomally synthesized peptide with SipW-like signal peptide
MNKKIIISLSVIGAIAAIAIGGTMAYFSDTETSTGNSFAAGTLNLQVGNSDPTIEKITVANMKPGATGNTAIWITKNTGSIAGKLTVAVSAITNNENACTEPEQHDLTPDTTCTTGTTDGELGANLKVAFWMDVDKNGVWSSVDYYLKSNGTKGIDSLANAYDILNNYGGKTWTNVQIDIAGPSDAGDFRVEYDLPGATGNIIQSDSSVFDITFTLNQQETP